MIAKIDIELLKSQYFFQHKRFRMNSLGGKLRRLDMYQKVDSKISKGTNIGGIISICTVLLILFFLFHQISTYMSPSLTAQILEDDFFARRQMTVHLDLTFPRFPCEIISLDLQDIMLSHHPNIGSIKKWRLDSQGRYLDASDFQLLREPNINKQYDLAKSAFQRKLGCRIRGSFTVKEVPGNFHVSSHGYANIFTRLKNDKVIQTLDVSHTINTLYFGNPGNIASLQKIHPQSSVHPLQNFEVDYQLANQQTQKSYTDHYHIDLVPTRYSQNFFTRLQAFQYTYNHNSYPVDHMPSVYFNYHVGGLSVNVRWKRSDFLSFLIKLCAVIGGTYTLANLMDTILHRLVGNQQVDLGK